jgi:uncharacterized membrane protein YvbJ
MKKCSNCGDSIYDEKDCSECHGVGYIINGSLKEQNEMLREIIIQQREEIGDISMNAVEEDA